MHIKWIHIRRLPPLGEVLLDCDERVNLFIGPNAFGKSTILRAIQHLHSLEPRLLDGAGDPLDDAGNTYAYCQEFCYLCGYKCDRDSHEGELGDITVAARYDGAPDSNRSSVTIWRSTPFLYMPATRASLPQQDIFRQVISHAHEKDDDGDYRPYPPNWKSLEAMFRTDFRNPVGSFDGALLEEGIDYIRRRLGGYRNKQSQFRKALEAGYSCARSICSEVIHDDVPHPYVELDEEREISNTGRIVHHDMGIWTTDDNLSEPLYAGALSAGTQGTLLWVWALALKMVHHYDWSEGWEKKPAVLLIDEIENHLHPTWQRRVIPALLKHFPKLQIFATTHSPFVVAGLKAGQVHLLKRDEHGSVTASTNTEDVIGWTADEILRTMMDVDEPTDQLTVDRVNQLRQLREKETLSPEEESELNGLRRQINKDLLAKGGPLEVEREHYADLMQEFLRNRQSELTQDTE